MISDALVAFARAVREDRRANASLPGDGSGLELLIAPRFHALLDGILAARLPAAPRLLPEYTRAGIGRPDLAFARPGSPARAFIELKAPGKTLAPGRWRGHDADQFRRFCELPLWALCNYHAFHVFRRNVPDTQVMVLPAAALDPATADAAAERLIRRHDPAPFLAALDVLAMASPVPPRDAREMAASLAHTARLVREIVADVCREGRTPALKAVQAEFRDTLFAHPKAGGYDDADEIALFANAFAQTLSFGLLLAREAGAADLDDRAWHSLRRDVFPLLSATLRALTQYEILEALGAAYDVIRDTIGSVDPALLTPRDGRDPILYFYEDFLAVFDPEARRKHGVYFTPIPVVRAMVSATDRALREQLGTEGLSDRTVTLLDPACGTGTFLLASAAHAIAHVRATWGEGAAAAEMDHLAGRLTGFELLVGPYTVAHYRLLREVASVTGRAPAARLPIYLADTLTAPIGAVGLTPHLGFMGGPIVAEREAADRLKRATPVLAIIGNPPYRRLETGEELSITSGWDNGFWEDLKAPVRNAGWGNELNTFPELSVAFWRWCLWKMFECEAAPGRGVVCLITNRTFLAGRPYAGLRRMLRRRFDRIEVLDLRGDLRGARPAGIARDEGVFAIQTGVCILTAVATGAPRAPGTRAQVRYADAWRQGAFTEAAKLEWVEAAQQDPSRVGFVEIVGNELDDFVPKGFAGLDWPALPECFAFMKSGVKTARDELVYSHSPDVLRSRVEEFLAAEPRQAWRQFFPSGGAASKTHLAIDPFSGGGGAADSALRTAFDRARAAAFDARRLERRVYRPLDVQFIYGDPPFVSRHAPALRAVWGEANLCLYAMPAGTGAGPAAWVHGLVPDYHAFRGSYGGYAFPLHDRRHGGSNLSPALLAGLAAAMGTAVAPQDVFDAMAALLSAASYTSRFAWDLEECFPHLPFPADPADFVAAARVGAEIRALQTFARAPGAAFRTTRLAGRASGVVLRLPAANAFRPQGDGTGEVALQEDGSLRLVGVPEAAWNFSVSGYRPLPNWLTAREGESLADVQRGACDIAWRITELLHWFTQADVVLARAIARPLTRAALGLPPPASQAGVLNGNEGDADAAT